MNKNATYKMDNYLIGSRLKDFRLQAGYSLARVAKETGITAAFISLVENGKSGISFKKAHALIKVYGKTLAELTATPKESNTIININNAPEISFETGVKICGLVKSESSLYVGGFRMLFEPGAQYAFDDHQGLEYVLALEGTFDLYLQKTDSDKIEVRKMAPGDTTTYPATTRHSFKNTSNKFGTLLILEISNFRAKKNNFGSAR